MIVLCPKCNNPTIITDSRLAKSYDGIVRRRRKCTKCAHRYTTIEMPIEKLEEMDANMDSLKKAIIGIKSLPQLQAILDQVKF